MFIILVLVLVMLNKAKKQMNQNHLMRDYWIPYSCGHMTVIPAKVISCIDDLVHCGLECPLWYDIHMVEKGVSLKSVLNVKPYSVGLYWL